jgi:putative ABC transport system permease protein
MNTMPLVSLAFRQFRSARQRLFLFLSAISLSIATLVAVQSFAANLHGNVRHQARAMLGADLELTSERPFDAPVQHTLAELAATGAEVAKLTSFVSMVRNPTNDSIRLVQVRAPQPGFPFYGAALTRPAGRWAALHDDRNAIVDPGLLSALGVSVGDVISLGETEFRITATIERMPGDIEITSSLAPRVFIPDAYVGETRLLGPGARADYTAFLRLPDPARAKSIEQHYRPTWRSARVNARSLDDQQEQLHAALGNLASYVGLLGVFALLLGGIGISSAMSAHMTREVDTIALLRCLGATSRQVIAIYLLQASAMGVVGAVLGILLGVGMQWTLPRLIADLLPVEVAVRIDGAAIAMGFLTGIWAAITFSLLPILQVRLVPPLAVLRRHVEAPPLFLRDTARWIAWALLLSSALAVILYQAPNVRVGMVIAASIAATLLVLAVCAHGYMRLLRRSPYARLSYIFRQGIASLFRPGNRTVTVVLSLGFGVFLLATLMITQASILQPLVVDAEGRANLMLLDVQPDQLTGIKENLDSHGIKLLQSDPLVPMRIAAIERLPTRRRAHGYTTAGGSNGDGADSDWSTHEYRSTYRDTLPSSDTLVAGAWWGAHAEQGSHETRGVSLVADIAAMLDVGVGDRIDWNVEGMTISTVVKSLRNVNLLQLEPHFFAIFEPGTLRDAPLTWLLLARAEDEAVRATFQRNTVARYPNVSIIDVTQVQGALDEIIGRVSFVVRFLASFSVATGFVVLLGAIATGQAQRVREVTLLKTIGATRRQIRAALFAEYALLGMLASDLGVALALAAAWALDRHVFRVPLTADVVSLTLISIAIPLLTALVGLSGSREVLQTAPLKALRDV